MKKEIFELDNFNIIQDDENYYFFRSLEPGDIEDIEKGAIKKGEQYSRLRTDRERWEETHEDVARWNAESSVSLEEMFMHIKMHYSLQTNCISLSSNANVARTYGEAFSDKYVMITVPKKEMGERVFHAGAYMLEEIEKRVDEAIANGEISPNIIDDINAIEGATSSDEIREITKIRYTSKEPIDARKPGMRKGIVYSAPHARVSSYQALNEEQTLEKNKIIAKLTVLEKSKIMEPIISNASNNNLLIQTLGSAFSSSEQIYYGDIEGNRITDISKEFLDMFGLLQQVEGQDVEVVDELKRELLQFINEGKQLEVSDESFLKRDDKVKEDISIEEMYELTEGKVEYGQANSIVKNMFYLAKGQLTARALAEELRKITNNNPKYERVIEYIEFNGFEIEPKITTRQTGKGYKLSESVNLNLKPNEIELVPQIKQLLDKEQMQIIEAGGLSNVQNIMSNTFDKTQRDEKISKEEYYAEAIFSLYDWKNIGIEEFTLEEKNNLLQRIQKEHCVELYQKLEEQGIERKDIPKILLNIITRREDFQIEEQDIPESIKEKRLQQYDRMIKENLSDLEDQLSIERVERFLGYYDVEQTRIQLRPYQQRAVEKTDEIFEKERFASVILPTGAGKSFVTLAKLMEHKDEEMLYLAPQNEILEQIKDYIVEYIHGPINTIGRSKEEIVADVFPNLKFSTYPGLLAREGKELIDKEYGFVVLDELHRTGAKEWGDRLNSLIDNQPETTKVLGITATPRRDVDGVDMAKEMAERLGYTNREAVQGKHVAMNMSLTNAIRMGLVVNPKLVSCAYNLIADGSMENLKERIDQIEDLQQREEELEKYEELRRNLEKAEGIEEILQSNVKKGGKYIVFLPMIENLEDEDGNVIGKKKGRDKIQDYEKQISQYFKDSDITPSFHSMLGEYGDKDNKKRLEEFQNANSDSTEFMLVMNKANEGLHLDKLDGIIWLRPMDENSRILYLQQLGRAIYAEDPDNPTKDEDRPVVIDLVNNTLKVNWDNEVTEQDDVELLTLIVDWSEKHDGTLPDINSTDKEEAGYATVLKEIQNKYKQYLEIDFENLDEEQIEEIREILDLGAQIDLWQSELPDKIVKNGNKGERSIKEGKTGIFEITGLLKDFVEINYEIDNIERKTTYEEVVEWLKEHNSKIMRAGITRNGKFLKAEELTEEEKDERNLYGRWRISKERKILEEYAGKPIEEVPEEYRKKIAKLREYGLGLKEKRTKTTYEEVVEWLENHDGQIMRGSIYRNGKQLKKEELTEEEKNETRLCGRWRISKEKKILEEYAGKPIEEVPEKSREKIAKLREYGLGIKEKTIYEEVIEWLEEHDGKIMRGVIKRNGKCLNVEEMIEEEKEEKNLYARWRISKERKILEEYAGKPIEEVPEEYREKISKLREYGLGMKEKTTYEEVVEWLEEHDGKIMRGVIKRNGKQLKKEELTEEEKNETRLCGRWRNSKERKILEEYAGQPIEEVPKEYRGKIAKLREYGLGMIEKITKEKTTYEEVIEWLEEHDGQIMRNRITKNGKRLKAKEMSEEEKDERNLYGRWRNSKERKILEEYAGQPIEEVPKEYRGKIAKLREYGLGMKEKTIYEEVIEWLENHDGQIMRGSIYRNGKQLKKEELAEEEKDERNLYARWRISKEKEMLEEYEGKPIEEVPEEYREKIAKLREYVQGIKQRKRTGKEIAEASISSLKDIEMSDREDMALKELVEKTKEGGINKDEQS